LSVGSDLPGLRNTEEKEGHINPLEMEVVFNYLGHFQTFLQSKHLVICGDNVTCLAYLRKQGGTVSRKLSIREEQILQWIFHHQTSFSTEFVPGNLNVLGDKLSRRNKILPTEGTSLIRHYNPLGNAGEIR